MSAHLGGEGMSRVDDMRHRIVLEIGGEPIDAAETAHASGQRLPRRAFDAAREGHHALYPAGMQGRAQGGRFGGAAKDEDIDWHG